MNDEPVGQDKTSAGMNNFGEDSTLVNWMTVRRRKSSFASATASTVGSMRVPLNLAINFKRWRHVGALICKGGDFPKGRVKTLGTGPDIIVGEADIEGGVKPMAGIAYEKRGYIIDENADLQTPLRSSASTN
jgi:hypothetical protein